MKTITFAYVHWTEITNPEFFNALYDMSPMRNESAGFSFVVGLKDLQCLLGDIETDQKENGAPLPGYYPELKTLVETLKTEGHKALFVCNDTCYEVK